MFVSSYNTYISTNSTQKSQPQKSNKDQSSTTFKTLLNQNTILTAKESKNLPISYISNYKAFNNKQRLNHPLNNSDLTEYKKITNFQNAKIAYKDNSKIFSFLLEPKQAQNRVGASDSKLSSKIKEAKEQNLRHTMINTYLENDRYYKISA